jgi:hypothetical protein
VPKDLDASRGCSCVRAPFCETGAHRAQGRFLQLRAHVIYILQTLNPDETYMLDTLYDPFGSVRISCTKFFSSQVRLDRTMEPIVMAFGNERSHCCRRVRPVIVRCVPS